MKLGCVTRICVYTVKYKKNGCLLIKNTTLKMFYKSNFK